jgi:hypothetical protein
MKGLWPFLFYIPLAIILLLFGVWIQLPPWIIMIMVLIPLSFGLFLIVLGRRRRDPASTDRYEISSVAGRSVGILELPIPRADIETSLRAVAENTPRLLLRSCDATGAELDASANWKTWGLIMSAKFESIDSTRTRVVVEARPRVKTNVIDLGQSRSDIHDLFAALERQVRIHQNKS